MRIRLPFAIVRRDEVVEALRANVGQLQQRQNRQARHVRDLENRALKLKKQIARDQAWINRLTDIIDGQQQTIARLSADKAIH